MLTADALMAEVTRKGLEAAYRRVLAALRPGDRFSGGEPKKIDTDLLLHQAMTLHRRALVLHTELRAAERALSEDPSESNFALLAELKAQLLALDGTEAEPEAGLSQSLDRPSGFR
jgi:DNA primase